MFIANTKSTFINFNFILLINTVAELNTVSGKNIFNIEVSAGEALITFLFLIIKLPKGFFTSSLSFNKTIITESFVKLFGPPFSAFFALFSVSFLFLKSIIASNRE